MAYFVFCGDSITTETYVPRVSNYAYRFSVLTGHAYVNKAIYGQYTQPMADAVSAQVLSYAPPNVMAMSGTNDAVNARQNNIPLTTAVASYKAAMSKWIGLARSSGRRVFVISPPISLLPEDNTYLRAFRDMLASLTAEQTVMFFDLVQKMDSHSPALLQTWFITGDDHHPGSTGHAYIFDLLAKSQVLR